VSRRAGSGPDRTGPCPGPAAGPRRTRGRRPGTTTGKGTRLTPEEADETARTLPAAARAPERVDGDR